MVRPARQRAAHEPIFDIHPLTGGKCSTPTARWRRSADAAPAGSGAVAGAARRAVGVTTGPFGTSYAAYRHAMTAAAPHLIAAQSIIHNPHCQCGHTADIQISTALSGSG